MFSTKMLLNVSGFRAIRCMCSKTRDITIIGAPFREGQPRDGVENGPRLLREAGLLERLQNLGLTVTDYGDLKFESFDEQPDYAGKIKHTKSCGAAARKVSEAVAEAIRQNRLCVTLGGDHSLAAGTIFGHFGVKEKDGCLIWVDAHADINTVESTHSGNLHGMPLSFILHGMNKLTEHVGKVPGYEWISPCLHPKNLVYIGLRDVDPKEKEFLEKLQIPSFFIKDIDDLGIEAVMDKALDLVNPNRDCPIHLSFDIDSMDPKEAPSTGTPVKGGLTFAEGIYIAETLANTGLLKVVDMVEVNPNLGDGQDVQKTVHTAITVLEACLGKKVNIEDDKSKKEKLQ